MSTSPKKGMQKKRPGPSTRKPATNDGATQLGRISLPGVMHDKAERLEELITERVVGSGVELAMLYEQYPKVAETRLRRLELAWRILNGTDGDALTTLLLAVEMVAKFAVKSRRLEDPAWIRTRILETIRELDEVSDLADMLMGHPSRALVDLVETVQLRGLNARRRSLADDDDDKVARWMAKLGEVLRALDIANLNARGTESRIRKARRSVGWPSPREQKVRGRRPRAKSVKE